MEQPILIETGAQLLARLTNRPSLQGLEEILFGDGPRHNEVVEVTGGLSSGKTLLVTQLLAKILLPQKYEDVQLNGLGAGAVLINTDHHFQIATLVNLMISFVRDVTLSTELGTKVFDDKALNGLVENSLRRLTVINCYENAQFLLSLQSLQTIVSTDEKIAIVAIDSISSFYWQDREGGRICSMNGYLKNCLKLMQKYTLYHKVVLLYTRPSTFVSTGKETVDFADGPEDEKVNYKIQLHKWNSNEFSAVVESSTNKTSLNYSINENGIQWRLTK